MPADPSGHSGGDGPSGQRRSLFGSGTTFLLVAIALILAIAFFYLTKDKRDDRRADAVTQAAESVDNATASIGSAAQNAASDLRQGQ